MEDVLISTARSPLGIVSHLDCRHYRVDSAASCEGNDNVILSDSLKSASLKQLKLRGIYAALTPDVPHLWRCVLFVRDGES